MCMHVTISTKQIKGITSFLLQYAVPYGRVIKTHFSVLVNSNINLMTPSMRRHNNKYTIDHMLFAKNTSIDDVINKVIKQCRDLLAFRFIRL